MEKKTLLFIAAAVCYSMQSFAQIGFSVDVEQGHASNAFSNYRRLPDDYTALEASVYYDWISSRSGLRIFYQPDFTWFRTYNYRSYNTQAVGTAYYFALNEKNDRISFGVNLRERNHSEDYQWFEFRQISANLDFRLTAADQLITYAGAYGYARSYDQLAPFSHGVMQGYFRLSKFFDSGTTFMAEADLMQKQYMESGTLDLPGFTGYVADGSGVNRQLVGMVRLAQSLGPYLGINGQLLLRRNSANTVRYLVSSEGDYYSDQELFDDVFGYDGEHYRIAAKGKLLWQATLEFSADYYQKRYQSRYAMDLEGNLFDDPALRRDQRTVFSFSFKKPFRFFSSASPLSARLDYSLVFNRSNDPYYHYRADYFSLSLTTSF